MKTDKELLDLYDGCFSHLCLDSLLDVDDLVGSQAFTRAEAIRVRKLILGEIDIVSALPEKDQDLQDH